MNKKYFWIGGIVTAIGAATWYVSNQWKLIDKLCFNVTGYNVISIAAQGAEVELNLSVRNLGKLTIKVNPKMMIQNIGTVLQNSSITDGWKNIELSMDGGAYLSKGVIPFYIPIKYDFKLSSLIEGSDVESPC